MDVRGPAEFDGKKSLPEPIEVTRIESAQTPSEPKSPGYPSTNFGSELAALGQHLKAVPEVRAELIAEARIKLENGEFWTRESAEKAAEAIMKVLGS